MQTTHVLDCADIDQYLGKPMDNSPLREPIGNNMRRWVYAMHYPNLLHNGHGAAPACVGCTPQ